MSNAHHAVITRLSASVCMILGLGACSTEAKTNPDLKSQQGQSSMNIRIDIEGVSTPVFATLHISPTTQDFIRQLPISLKLQDYAATEKIANLPQKLSMQDAPQGYVGKAGDLTYYAPWGNLAIFYKDSEVGYANGLILLAKIDQLPNEFSKQPTLNISINPVD